MGTAKDMIAAARDDLGMSGRPNAITREYAKRHGDEFLRAPWCQMSVTHWARVSGNAKAVTPGGDRAYTVWAAQDFQKIGRWHTGTTANVNKAKPGDIVFFDWGGSNSIAAIDHVGVVEKVLGDGRLQTLEANTGDAVKRRVRSSSVIAGYGRPAYDDEPSKPKPKPESRMLRLATPMMRGDDVKDAQRRLNAHGAKPKLAADGVFGPKTDKEVRDFQRAHRLEVDGIIGPKTREALAKKP